MTTTSIARLSTVALQSLLEKTVAAQAGLEADGLEMQADQLNPAIDRIEAELYARREGWLYPTDTPALNAPWWEAR